MVYYLLTCRSLTYAQRGLYLLSGQGIPGKLIRSPAELTNKGCGYAVTVSARRLQDAVEVLRTADALTEKVYYLLSDGSFREAEL